MSAAGGNSGEDDPPKRRPARGLSGEDKELWRFVTRDVTPMASPRRPAAANDHKDQQAEPPPAPQSRARVSRAAGRTAPTGPVAPSPARPSPSSPRPAPAQPPAVIDRRKTRRIARGRQPIEARIDLHGMFQSEAHVALRGFLMRCYGQGLRHVLVITGKGGASDDTEHWTATERRRGVLRRNVPRWLAEPDLAAIVVATAPAHIRHGGEGALYVTLRSARRRDDE